MGAFAAAVCRAGGLGMIGISEHSPDDVRAEVSAAAAAGASYGIGLLAWAAKDRPDLLDVVRELQPPFVSLSYGDYGPLVAPLREAGITVATQVGTIDEAARRWTPESTSSWPAAVRAAATDATQSPRSHFSKPCSTASMFRSWLPEVSAPHAVSPRSSPPARSGAWVGTAFLGCSETMWSPARRSKVLAADLDSTIYTRVYDIAMQQPWPAQYGGRVVRNAFTDTWHGREDELAATPSVRADLEAAARPRGLRPILRLGRTGGRSRDR